MKTKYYITSKVNENGFIQSVVSSANCEKMLSENETGRLINEELQNNSLDNSIEIDKRFFDFLTGKTKSMKVKKIVICKAILTN